MTRLLMVMPYRQLVRKAREEGFWVCSVWDPRLESEDYLREVEELSDVFLTADFGDQRGLRRIVGEAADRHRADLVYHLGREDSMLPVYEVAEAMGRSLNPARSIHLLNDKWAMRALLAAGGTPSVRYAPAADLSGVRRALLDFGLPAIVKPTRMSGSRCVYLLRAPEEVGRWEELVAHYAYQGPFLLEEHLEGPEFSVETMSCEGRHQVIGITRKELGPVPLFVEMGHLHPAPLPSGPARAIEDSVIGLLDAAGYRFGPAHTEVILTGSGPRIVESQARLGGGRIPRLVELTTGLDVERAIFRCLQSGRLPATSHRGAAQLSVLHFAPGRIESVGGLDAARRLEFVDELVFPHGPGDVLPVTRDAKSRHGHVIVTGDSWRETEARVRQVNALVDVRTGPELAAVAGREARG